MHQAGSGEGWQSNALHSVRQQHRARHCQQASSFKVVNVLVTRDVFHSKGACHALVAVSGPAGRQESEQRGETDGGGPAAGGHTASKAQASEGSATTRAAGQAPKGWLAPSNALLPRHGIFYSSTFSKRNGLPSSSEPSFTDSAHWLTANRARASRVQSFCISNRVRQQLTYSTGCSTSLSTFSVSCRCSEEGAGPEQGCQDPVRICVPGEVESDAAPQAGRRPAQAACQAAARAPKGPQKQAAPAGYHAPDAW